MLTRVFADNYRTFLNFEFRPGAINLLVGDNGVGKTAVFDVLTAIRDLVVDREDLGEVFPADTLTRWNNRRTQRFELDVRLPRKRRPLDYAYVLEVFHDPVAEEPRVKRESLSLNGKKLFEHGRRQVTLFQRPGSLARTSFPHHSGLSFLGSVESKGSTRSIGMFADFLRSMLLISPTPSEISGLTDDQSPWLESDCSNFADFLAFLHENTTTNAKLRPLLRGVLPGYSDLSFVRIGSQLRQLHLRFKSPSKGPYRLDFDELSDGQKVLFVLWTLLGSFYAGGSARLLLLDEPDNYLASAEIQPFLMELSTAVRETDAQAFVISHNAEVIDYLAADNAYLLQRGKRGATTIVPLSVDRELGLAASEWLARRLYGQE